MKTTLVYSDTEGWNRTEQFHSVGAAREYVRKEIGTPGACEKQGYNPAPILIVGDAHEIKELEGYHYS